MYPESLESDTEEEQREKEVIVQKVSKRDKKAMAYFMERIRYKRIHNWHECILKDVEDDEKECVIVFGALDVLDGRRNDISAEKLMKIVQDCQTDVHDFWSAFYLHFIQ